jgi:hypothetical protein
MKFFEYLIHFMKEHKIKQCHLIAKAGFNSNVLYWWMVGRNLPNSYSLAVLCTALSELSGIPRKEILEEFCISILKS